MNIFTKLKRILKSAYTPQLTATQIAVQIDRLTAAIKRREDLPTEVREDAKYLADAAKLCIVTGHPESARNLVRDAWELLIATASQESGR